MGQTILIVEDDPSTCEAEVGLLAEAGYDTITASTVPSALEILKTRRPDLLLTDVRLDAYNGLQLIAMAPEPIPAIVLTGYDDPSLKAEAQRMGAEYLVKPVTPTVLREVVARKLASAAQAGVFREARRAPRRRVVMPLSVQAGTHVAHLIDISAGGLRLEIRCVPGQGLPPSISVRFVAFDVSLRVAVVWKRRLNDTTWMCGAAIDPSDKPQWQRVLATV
ncbi:MAG: hypothetical protein A3F70_10040 [Acidobacteria bacterium RIFCSPLOWO2_12_FULL_67_14]|nr:MAG: hypothetical protein A3H29_00250 [Acidobacteria bacterium RIFCSPLOWO2_02_FULL_67_21]OFW38092.1 MAG: hypothetical protein A3F70_10040 [Acidobacteria bacterium RIFCSPLOWO2_12_FULL_67_14]